MGDDRRAAAVPPRTATIRPSPSCLVRMRAIEAFCERCGARQPAARQEDVGSGRFARRLLSAVGWTADGVAQPATSMFLRLCLECRGYSCPACWNEAAGCLPELRTASAAGGGAAQSGRGAEPPRRSRAAGAQPRRAAAATVEAPQPQVEPAQPSRLRPSPSLRPPACPRLLGSPSPSHAGSGAGLRSQPCPNPGARHGYPATTHIRACSPAGGRSCHRGALRPAAAAPGALDHF